MMQVRQPSYQKVEMNGAAQLFEITGGRFTTVGLIAL